SRISLLGGRGAGKWTSPGRGVSAVNSSRDVRNIIFLPGAPEDSAFGVIALRVPAHRVIAGHDGARALRLEDAITLRAAGGASIGDLVLFDHNVAGLRLNVETIAGLLTTVIEHFVFPECVPVSTIEEGLGPEIHAALAISGYGVFHELVVGILVSY